MNAIEKLGGFGGVKSTESAGTAARSEDKQQIDKQQNNPMTGVNGLGHNSAVAGVGLDYNG